MFPKLKKQNKNSGFTLLEILLVVGIIAILAGIVIVAINPAKMLAKTRDTQRRIGVSEISKAITQYYIDKGHFPTSLSPEINDICVTGDSATSTGFGCENLVDLSVLVPDYLPSIPTDPTGVGYKAGINHSGNPMLIASLTETGPPIIAVGTTTVAVGGGWTCGSSLSDSRDGGKTYSTVQIGSQCWMQQNINVGTMTSGGNTQGTSTSNIQKYCYNNTESNCTTYGGLYQWNQAMGGSVTEGTQGICMTGWHIPTDTEYKTLVEGQATPGCESSIGWQCSPAGSHLSNLTLNHDNSSSFTALLAGNRVTSGSFTTLNVDTNLWSSVQSGNSAWTRYLRSDFASVYRTTTDKAYGFSVRCLKD